MRPAMGHPATPPGKDWTLSTAKYLSGGGANMFGSGSGSTVMTELLKDNEDLKLRLAKVEERSRNGTGSAALEGELKGLQTRMNKMEGNGPRGKGKGGGAGSSQEERLCYKCNKPGHISKFCPNESSSVKDEED